MSTRYATESLEIIMPIKITKEDMLLSMAPGVFILRGLPGSGKSTFAKQCLASYKNHNSCIKVCSADDFWMRNGEYRFDSKEVPQNHQECLRKFIDHAIRWINSTILVDNTNTSISEMETYIKIAQAYGLDVSIVTFNCSIERSISRNTHQVPEGVIKGMFEKMCYANERLDKYCDRNHITSYEID
jgi:predicted kinase